MIHVRKVMEHVYEKIVLADNGSSTTGSQNGERQNSQPKLPPDELDLAALAEAKIELYCNDMVRVRIQLQHNLNGPLLLLVNSFDFHC